MAHSLRLTENNDMHKPLSMKIKLLTYLLLLGSWSYGFAYTLTTDTVKHQKTKSVKNPATRKLTIQELEKMHKPWFDNCTFTNQYTLGQRLKKYPFSKAAKILAVSFRCLNVPDAPSMQDSLKKGLLSAKAKKLRGGLHIVKDSLDYVTLQEFKQLKQDQINQLTNIIYNTNYRKTGFNTIEGASCYDPRNAFVFFDKKGKVYDYLEICFACQHYASKSDRLDVGVVCTQKYDMLRKYFINIGVTYGTIKNMKRN